MFEYDLSFDKCENIDLIITNKDEVAQKKIKDGYMPYVDPSRDAFKKCYKYLNEHYYILVKITY